MDNTAQNNQVPGVWGQGDKGNQTIAQSQATVQPTQNAQAQQVLAQPASQGLALQGEALQRLQGQVQKEQEPTVSQIVSQELIQQAQQPEQNEQLTVSEIEPELHPEVIEAGVKTVKKPQVGQDVIKAGLSLAKEEVLVRTQPSGLISLPMTEEEAEKIVKLHKRVSDSILWLATEIVRQFKMLHGKITK